MILTIVLCILNLGLINGQDSEWKYYYESGIISEEYSYKNGVAHGLSRSYYESGSLEKEGHFVDGLENGTWKIYYENGQLLVEGNFNMGQRRGVWKVFYKSGALQAEGIFTILETYYKEYSPFGIVEAEGILYDGNDSGYCKYYYDSGYLMSEGEFINGLEHGYWKKYYPSGFLESESIYEVGNILISRNFSDNIIYNMCTIEQRSMLQQFCLQNLCTEPLWNEYL